MTPKSGIYRFARANDFWWRKPLVLLNGKAVPAELAVLAHVLEASEEGVWLNSRRKASGVIDLRQAASKKTYETVRRPLPLAVAKVVDQVNQRAGAWSGCPDLAIWRRDGEALRFVEVKNPHWDRTSKRQVAFMEAAEALGIPTSIAEWEFADAD